jgi:hypothetical protein
MIPLSFRYTHYRTGTNYRSGQQDQIDAAIDTWDEAYAPESTREDLAEAIGNALDILRGEEDEGTRTLVCDSCL